MADSPTEPSSPAAGSDGLPVASDSVFQGRLRRLQSRWRAERGLPIGEHRGRPLGSRIAMPYAEETLANYLTPTIRDVVRREVLDRAHGQRKLYSRPRIFDDLLSSQPLCFNLFGELSTDLELATNVCRALWPGRVHEVTAIEFEWSPGRRDARFLGNNSAFDVVIFHTTARGARAFIGIEVKYHENLRVGQAVPNPRYIEIACARTHGVDVFGPTVPTELQRPPLQQIWLDHLLALAMLQAGDEYGDGLFVFLFPAGNRPCEVAALAYEARLVDARTFQRLTLEDVVAAIGQATDAEWVDELRKRYLALDEVTAPDVNTMPDLDTFEAD